MDKASNSNAGHNGGVVADVAPTLTPHEIRPNRKPAANFRVRRIKSGDKVADYVADAGYFTRLFASMVGSTGHVPRWKAPRFF